MNLNEETCLLVPLIKLSCHLCALCYANGLNCSQLHFSDVAQHINKSVGKDVPLKFTAVYHFCCCGTFQRRELKVKSTCCVSAKGLVVSNAQMESRGEKLNCKFGLGRSKV